MTGSLIEQEFNHLLISQLPCCEHFFWKSIFSSFEEEPELCMKAVFALYGEHISKDEMSANELSHYSDARRFTTLAKFLMDGACKTELKREIFDSKGVKDCKRLATNYSKQLFSIYQSRKDTIDCCSVKKRLNTWYADSEELHKLAKNTNSSGNEIEKCNMKGKGVLSESPSEEKLFIWSGNLPIGL